MTWLTSTQLGAVGETAIASGLILATKGRLALFKPFADDDGIDLLILTRRRDDRFRCRSSAE